MATKYLTLARAARYLHIDGDRMDRLVDQCIIPAYSIKDQRMVARSDLDFWHAAQKPPTNGRKPDGALKGKGIPYSKEDEEYILAHLNDPPSSVAAHLKRGTNGIRKQIALYRNGHKTPRTGERSPRFKEPRHRPEPFVHLISKPENESRLFERRETARGIEFIRVYEARLHCPICRSTFFLSEPGTLPDGSGGTMTVWICTECHAAVTRALMRED